MNRKENNLKNESDVWLGQERRKRAMETVKRIAKELLPMEYNKFSCIISYRTGLSLRKITDEYLKILIEIGFIKRTGDTLHLEDYTESETPFMDKVKSGELKPRNDVPDK